MCLTIQKSFSTRQQARDFLKNPSILDKDMIVYKVLLTNNCSPYRGMYYEKGMHYYREGRNIFTSKIHKYPYIAWRVQIHEGLHAFTDLAEAQNVAYRNDKKIVKMVIPKGSRYFRDDWRKEIVADNLIWY